MRAGSLRERLTFEKPSSATDPTWGKSLGWVTGAEAWASVTPIGAGERNEGNGVLSNAAYEVRVRYMPDVTSAWRVVWRGRVLDMVSVVDVGARRRELLIRAVEHPQGS